MKTVAEWFEEEPGPKGVGASEYTVIHEHVQNVIEDWVLDETDDDPNGDLAALIDSSLDELVQYAQEMQSRLWARN